MKITRPIIIAFAAVAAYALSACGDHGHDHDHDDHAGHDHDKKPHADEKGKDGGHDGHDHDAVTAEPNGGRVLTGVEPHAEFFVTDDRKVQITFVDDDLKPVPAGEQTVKVSAGDRTNPTRLSFQKSGDVLLSDIALPEGNDFPVAVQIKTTADAKSVNEKFNLDFTQCPTCKYKEYACTCEHGEEEE